MRIETVSYDHPDALPLIAAVQQEYVVRYGEQDRTPVDLTEFEPPCGLFLLGYVEHQAVASGGWRAHESPLPNLRAGDAELKRMYVTPEARGRGLARQLLAELEHTAALAGCKRAVLETGIRQPEAIALYRSSGYHEIPKFGVYGEEPDSCCYAKEL